MSPFSALYTLFIGPLELFFDVLYSMVYRVIYNAGLSIIFLSLAMNFLVLPLYRKADALQAEERDLEARLKPWVDHIKRTFKGDERFMILQTYYRQNGFKPTNSLRGTISLLLEIPFFIAAYRFLSGLELLQGVPFGPIRNLSTPDALLTIAGISINVLPILMTAINIVSGAIYTKGFPLKSKIQLYGMALIFLVLLYNSPSGLVFYWTLNNLFSLFKNIFYKLKNPKRVLGILSSLAGVAAIAAVFLFMANSPFIRRKMAVAAVGVLLQLPLLLDILHSRRAPKPVRPVSLTEKRIFTLSCVFLAVLTGLLIPSALIRHSEAEFISIWDFRSPLLYVLTTGLLAAGTFLIWFRIFFGLSSERGKRALSFVLLAAAIGAAINYMVFGNRLGTLSSTLVLDANPRFSSQLLMINLAVLLAAAILLYALWRWRPTVPAAVSLAACAAVLCMSAVNMIGIGRETNRLAAQLETIATDDPQIRLSKNGKNVIVLMLDRGIAAFTPYVFNEKPELKEQFSGFTNYTKTLSYGFATNSASPPLFGGYDYLPEKMNERTEMSLADKHNEALKVMPVLFDRAGYEVTLLDPTYAGYQWIPDLSVFNDYPQFHTYITDGRYDVVTDGAVDTAEHARQRNMFCYSIMKIAPLCMQDVLYNGGDYNESDTLIHAVSHQSASGVSVAYGYNRRFTRAYAVLKTYPTITVVDEDADATFTMMSNDTAHEPCLLQTPEYVPSLSVDNREYDAAHELRYRDDGQFIRIETLDSMTHYHALMAAMIELGQWFDCLRDMGVYDNTRIIIAADHGRRVGQFPEMIREDLNLDVLGLNPLLMVKDFNAEGFHVSDSFMTNGDVPFLATEGLISDPHNPFTGTPINMDPKNSPEQHIIDTTYDLSPPPIAAFDADRWITVRGDITDMSNWSIADHP